MILIIDNYDSFTWNLVQRLGELEPSLELGTSLVVVRNDKITPEQADALDHGRGPSKIIISPGPCTPRQAGISPEIITHFAGRIPILGVCLGHQCIASLAGMTVTQHTLQVHGKTSLIHHDNQGLFANLPNPMTATRYHSLVVLASSVPPPPAPGEPGWIVSAYTDDPGDPDDPASPPQRVVMGLRRVWSPSEPHAAPLEGVQFHPESFLTTEGPQLLQNFLDL